MPNPSNKFLFTTPKTVTTSNDKCLMQIMTANNTLVQFFIDKAHCIDCWGFNFCPSYSSLGSLKDYGVPIVALSTRYVNISECRKILFGSKISKELSMF